MISKLKIDLINGCIEVEGSEEFVSRIYADFNEKIEDKYKERTSSAEETSKIISIDKTKESSQPADRKTPNKRTKKSKKTASNNPKILKELDVYENPSVQNHLHNAEIKKVADQVLLVIDYLKNTKKISEISLDHVYTCFEALEEHKENFGMFFRNSSRIGYFSNNFTNIDLTAKGKNRLKELKSKST